MNDKLKGREDPRLAQMLDVIFKFAAGDLTARGTLADDGSALDGVMAGINILGEKLEAQVAENQQTQQALADSEARLSSLFDSVQDGILVADARTRHFRMANAAMCRMLGYKLDELLNLGIDDIHPEEDLADVARQFERQLKGEIDLATVPVKRKDGSVFYADINTNPMTINGIACLAGVFRDTTERIQAEQALGESQALLRTVFDSVQDGIVLVDAETRQFRMSNASFQRMLGYGADEIFELGVEDIHPREEMDNVNHHLERQIKQEYSLAPNILVKRKDGSTFFADINTQVMMVKETAFLLAVFTDITERRQAELALKESEEKYRGLFENSRDALMVLTPPLWGISDANQATLQMFGGASKADFAALGPGDVSPERQPDGSSSAEKAQEMIATALREGSHAFEWQSRRLNGELFAADVLLSCIELGGQTALQCTMRDISERNAAEKALQDQFHLLQVLLDAIPAPVFYKDTLGVYTGCNKAFEEYLGKEKEQIVGKSVYDMAPKALAETYHQMDLALLEEQGTQIYESSVVYADGTKHNVIFNKAAFHNKDGSLAGLVGVILDITAAKQAEETLRFKNTILSILQQTSPSAILVVDENARIISFNEQFIQMWDLSEELVGAGSDEALLQHVFEQIENPEEFLARVQYLYEHEKATSRDELLLLDGRIIDRHSSPIVDDDGRFYGRVWDFRDITELKRATEKIGQLNQSLEEKIRQLLDARDELVRKEKLALLGQVAGGVGHELRNPLAVMNNAVYFLQTVLADADETTREYLEILKVEIDDADCLVSELLDSVRTKPPQPTAVSVGQLIDQTLRTLTLPATMTVTLDLPETLPPLRVDGRQIQQVFRNLINNGVQAMAEGGTLEIRAVENRSESTVTVSVHDNGSGIAPEILDKLFQPLFTTKARGIGLGLVVVKNLTEANGGTVRVESVPGEGSRFFVTLPSGAGDRT